MKKLGSLFLKYIEKISMCMCVYVYVYVYIILYDVINTCVDDIRPYKW